MKKIKKFFEVNKKVDWVLIFNSRYPFLDKNFFYFTDFEDGFENCGFLFSKKRKILLLNKMEAEKLKNKDFEITIFKSKKDFFKKIKELIKNEDLGINCNILNYNFIKDLKRFGIKWKDVSKELEEVRRIKDADEIKNMEKASKITCKIFDEILKEIREGIREFYLKNLILKLFIEKNCKIAFEPIVAFGKNTAIPHYFSGKDKLKKNSAILIDLGANYKNYICDFTRSIYFGKPSNFFNQIYEKVKKVELSCIERAKEGFKAKNFYKYVKKIFGKYEKNFLHALGHEVGLEVHEGIALSPDNNLKLKQNMAIAIEPGLYFNKKFGIRIEDTIIVKKKKAKLLTKYTRELIEI